jgi:putative pyruvate formate lyase activating enzyme
MLFTLNEVTEQIVKILEKGINSLGFVSPTHFLPQAIAITEAVRSKGHSPVTVWNSNGYELPECLELLDPYVDIFLPDFKYSDERVSEKYSDAPAYPQIALAALKKMQEMRGTRLLLDDNGQGYRGMLIRHLVLPGSSDQSCGVLRTIAEDLSLKIPVSLMSQYHPCHRAAAFPEINRTVGLAEYRLVKNEMQKLGLAGWVQEPESAGYYLPDFHSNNPFAE